MTPSSRPRTLVELLCLRAKEEPGKTAYIELRDGEEEEGRLSWGDLDRLSRQIAVRILRDSDPGDRVLLLYPTGLDFIAAYMGCLYAGVIPVPCYPPSRQRPDRRLESIVQDCGSRRAFTSSSVIDSLGRQFEAFPILREVAWMTTGDAAGEDPDAWSMPAITADDLALLQYTSGSTSEPRGVMVSHGHLLANLAHLDEGWDHDAASVMVTWLPVFHDMGLIYGALEPLFRGFPCVMMTPASFLQSPIRWLKAITRYRGTHSAAPNFAYDLCVERIMPEDRAGLDLSSWRMALNAAEPVRAETLERFEAAFGPCGFSDRTFSPGFGLAEATLKATALGCSSRWQSVTVDADALARHDVVPVDEHAPGGRRLVGCGPAVAATRIAIVDPATRAVANPDRVGEIWVGGETIPFGYWNRAETTESTFQARLADGQGPFLRTGDLGFVRGGELYITGRLKDLIIVHGLNHYPQDLEWTAERSHPALRPGGGAAFSVSRSVAAPDDKAAGKGASVDEELVVLVHEIGREHLRTFDADAVLTALRRAVFEEHGLALSGVALVKPGGVPKTSSGKVRRGTCRDAWIDHSLESLARWEAPSTSNAPAAASATSVSNAPGTGDDGLAEGLAAVTPAGSPAGTPDGTPAGTIDSISLSAIRGWLAERLAAIRGIAPSAVALQEPFALFGLDSIAAVRMAGELSAFLGRALPPTLFYDHPSPQALATFLAGESDGARSSRTARRGESRSPRTESPDGDAVAIIGMACRFPGASNIQEFWSLLREGRSGIRDLPEGRWDPAVHDAPVADAGGPDEGVVDAAESTVPVPRRGGYLDAVDQFDAEFFGIAPREAESMDPQQRLMLEVAWEALESAGRPAPTLAGSRTGVFVGIAHSDYNRLLFAAGHVSNLYAGTGNALSVAANRLSYTWDLRGPSLAVDTACSSSLVAVHLAARSLQSGESDLALAGGVNLMLSPDWTVSFTKTGFLSPDGLCKTFDESANGYVRGEGCGCVVLKRLTDARRDGDPVIAVIRGSAVNQDGRSNGLTAPSGPRQADVIREALADAGVSAGAIGLVEAHGTGTPLGDPIEMGALKTVLLEGRDPSSPCRIGSVKSNIGHLECAAGMAGIIKAALALHHGAIPASLNLVKLNPRLGIEGMPIVVPTSLVPWQAPASRFAGVSSFGFGGTNAHIVLASAAPEEVVVGSETSGPRDAARDSEAREDAAREDARDGVRAPGDPVLLPLSARDSERLGQTAALWAEALERGLSLDEAVATASLGRARLDHRLAVVAYSAPEAIEALRRVAAGDVAAGVEDERVSVGRRPASAPSGPVFLYTGQGAQKVGMGRELYDRDAVYRAALDRCDEILAPILGFSIREAIHDGDEKRLIAIEVAQPALFSLQVALTLYWRSRGVNPIAVIGHSVGEIAAAWAAGILTLEDGLRIAAERGRLMSTLSAGATMVSIMAPEEDVASALKDLAPNSSIAVLNAPRNIVVSGLRSEVEALAAHFTAREVKCTILQIPLAAHSPHVDPILDTFRAVIASTRLGAPRLPFYTNLTGREDGARVATASYWPDQMRGTVRFADAIRSAAADGHRLFLEIGPHPTLCGLGAQCVDEDAGWAASLHRDRPAHQQVLAAAGALYCRGLDLDWSALDVRRPPPLSTAPGVLYRRRRFWFPEPLRSDAVQVAARRASSKPPELYGLSWRRSLAPSTTDERRAPQSRPASSPASLWFVATTSDAGAVRDGAAAGDAGAWLDALGASGCEARPLVLPPPANAFALTDADADRLRSGGVVMVAGRVADPVLARSLLLQLLALTRDLRAVAPGARLVIVTTGAQAVLPEDRLTGLAGSLLWGFAKTIMAECPELKVRLVDVEDGASSTVGVPSAIGESSAISGIEELFLGDAEDHVAYRHGERYVLRIERAMRDAAAPLEVRPDATYLITGGLGALGTELALGLADRGATRLALLSRSGLNSPARETIVAELRQRGVEVLLPRGDSASVADVAATLAVIATPGKPLRGIVHAAGAPGYRPLFELDEAEIDSVLAAKVFGTQALLDATADRKLDFFVCVSSMTASWGAGRHAHYTAANHFMDMACIRAARYGRRAVAVALGPLAGGGMLGERMIAELERMGVTCRDLAEGAADVLALGGGDASHVVAATIDWTRYRAVQELRRETRLFADLSTDDAHAGEERRDSDESRHAGSGAATAPPRERADGRSRFPARDRLIALQGAERAEQLLGYVLDETCAVLKMRREDWEDPDRGFFASGMDSLTALELKRRIERGLGVALRATTAFDHPSPSRLRDLLGTLLTENEASGEPGRGEGVVGTAQGAPKDAGKEAARGAAAGAAAGAVADAGAGRSPSTAEGSGDLADRIARLERLVGPS